MMMTEQNTFKHYDSPEQYAEAFQQIHYTVGFYKDTIFMDDGVEARC